MNISAAMPGKWHRKTWMCVYEQIYTEVVFPMESKEMVEAFFFFSPEKLSWKVNFLGNKKDDQLDWEEMRGNEE